MPTAITILCVLTGGAFAIGGLLKEDGRHNAAYDYFLLGYALSGVTILLAFIHGVRTWRRKSKIEKIVVDESVTALHPHRPKNFKFNAYWDSDLNPYCPVCQTPLTLSIKKLIYRIDPFNNSIPPPPPVLHCLKCDDIITLYDDDGNELTLGEAKQLLSPIKRKEIDPPKPYVPSSERRPAPQVPKSHVYEPDDKDKEIIRYLYKSDVDRLPKFIAEAAGLDGPETELRLNKLIKEGYVRRPPRRTGRDAFLPNQYPLTDKGKQFVIDNDLRDINSTPETVEPAAYEPDYEPDELARNILIQIEKGNGYESEIARALNIDTKQISQPLSLLEQHKYILLQRPTSRAPYYLLGDKGRDYFNKPAYTVPHPTGEGYMPDETSVKILLLLAQPDYNDAYDLAEELQIHVEKVKYLLGELDRNYYVTEHHNFRGPNPFSLTHKGRKFLVDRNLIK